jgi:hypothetical protein
LRNSDIAAPERRERLPISAGEKPNGGFPPWILHMYRRRSLVNVLFTKVDFPEGVYLLYCPEP